MFKKRIISLAMALLILVVTTLSATAISVAETNYLSAEITQNGEMTIRGNLFGEWLGSEVAVVILKPGAVNMSPQEAIESHPELVEQVIQTTTDSYGKFVYTHTLEDIDLTGPYTVMMSYRNTETLEADRTVVCDYDPVEGLFANAHIDTNGRLSVFGSTPRLGNPTLNIEVKYYNNGTLESLFTNGNDDKPVNDKFVWQQVLPDTSKTGVYEIYVSGGGYTAEAKTIYFGAKVAERQKKLNSHPLQLFVSPDADEFGAGTEESPFSSVQEAVDLIERLDINEDVNVFLRGGNHYLASTLELNADNTFSNGRKLTFTSYPGERATIHGGKTITGWKNNGDGKWYADVDLDDFRELYVNGEPARRARTETTYQGIAWYNTSGLYYNDVKHYPKYEFSQKEVAPDALHTHDMPNKGGTSADTHGFRGGLAISDTGELANISKWGNQEDIELYDVNKTYKHLRLVVKDVVSKNNPTIYNKNGSTETISGKVPVLLFNAQASYAATDNMSNYPWLYSTPFYMENAYELLDNENEWYYDNDAHRLYYMPEAGVNANNLCIEVPQLEELITITGTSSEDKVSNVSFKDLDIGYSTWRSVNELGAYASMQAGQTLVKGQDCYAGAISLNYTDGIDFIGCTIKNIGSAGIVLKQGTANTDITDNEIYNIATTAISVGKTEHVYVDEKEVCTNTNILRNNIHNIANQYTSNTGIWAMYTSKLNISYNEIHDMPYTGVSVGWGWNSHSDSTTCHDNTISYNYIYNVMLTQCYDGAPIYTLGNQPGTKINNNYIFVDNPLGHAIYLDEGSNHITVTQNVVNVTDKAYNHPDYLHETDWLRITHLRLPGDTTEFIEQECVVEGNYTTTKEKDVVAGLVNDYDNLLAATKKDWKVYLLENNFFAEDNALAMDEAQAIIAGAGIHGVYVAGGAVMSNPGTSNAKFLTTDGSEDTVAYFRIKNYDSTDIKADRRFVIYEGKKMKSTTEPSLETISANSDEWYSIPVDTSFYNTNTIKGAPKYKVFFWEVYDAEKENYIPLLKSVELYN